jgi:hypothetical protein
LSNIIQQSGKVKVYYKFVGRLGSDSKLRWGIDNELSEKPFVAYMRVEIFNTTNAQQIIRDLRASLYHNNTFIKDMLSNEFIGNPQDKQNRIAHGDEGRYSFVIQPRSIGRFELFFSVDLDGVTNSEKVNRIRITYYDSKDKKKGGCIIEGENLLSKSSSEMSNWTEL